MKIDNKIEKLFSSAANFAGSLFLVTGIFIIPQNNFSIKSVIPGILILLLALFVIFTFSGVEINTEKNKVKQYYKIFGLIKIGNWKDMQNFLGVTLIPMRKIQGMASMSNRTTRSIKKDYRIFLVNKAKKPAFAIKTCKSRENGQTSLDEFAIWLKMPVFSIKK